jgi:hypothetical protein
MPSLWALCGLGLMYMPNAVQALREVLGVLKTGGRAAPAVWGERRKCGWAELFPIVDSVVQSEVCPLFFGLGTGNSLANAFDEAGFVSVRTQRLTATANYSEQHDVLTAMLDSGAVALAAKRFDVATGQHVEAMLLASLAEYRNKDGGYTIPGEFVIVVGRRP